MNYEEIGELIKLLYKKDEKNILKALRKSVIMETLEEYLSEYKRVNTYNYLSRFIFIVSDLDSFINSIAKTIGSEVNQGPQKHRGTSSYISYILISLDKAFRASMYNHNRTYVNYVWKTQDKYDIYIPKSCFSFKNIHINLGKVR